MYRAKKDGMNSLTTTTTSTNHGGTIRWITDMIYYTHRPRVDGLEAPLGPLDATNGKGEVDLGTRTTGNLSTTLEADRSHETVHIDRFHQKPKKQQSILSRTLLNLSFLLFLRGRLLE